MERAKTVVVIDQTPTLRSPNLKQNEYQYSLRTYQTQNPTKHDLSLLCIQITGQLLSSDMGIFLHWR